MCVVCVCVCVCVCAVVVVVVVVLLPWALLGPALEVAISQFCVQHQHHSDHLMVPVLAPNKRDGRRGLEMRAGGWG